MGHPRPRATTPETPDRLRWGTSAPGTAPGTPDGPGTGRPRPRGTIPGTPDGLGWGASAPGSLLKRQKG